MCDDTSTFVFTWRIGVCSNCLVSLNPEHVMARIKQNGILGQLLRDSWLAFTEGLL